MGGSKVTKHASSASEADLLKALHDFTGSVVHLTHTDLDAVCADAIHRRAYGNVLTIFSPVRHYMWYLNILTSCTGQRIMTLSMSDLGGVAQVHNALLPLVNAGWSVEWRDHHVWDEGLVTDVRGTIQYLRVDRRYCACELVFQDLLPHDDVARAIACLGRDRDFWINEDSRSEILSTVTDTPEWKAIVSDKLSRGIFIDSDVTREFERVKEHKRSAVRQSVLSSKLFDNVAVTRGTGYSSDSADALRSTYNSKVELIINDSGVFSIRSTEPISHRIAACFGGGGHPNAAGGSLDFNVFEQVTFKILKFRQRKVQKLIETAQKTLKNP